MRLRPSPRLVLLVSLLLLAASAWAADKRDRHGDAVWTAPDFAEHAVASIALLPVATYDDNLDARTLTERALGQALRGTGYRWLRGSVTQELLQRAGRDSLVRAVRGMLTDRGRVDSLAAPLVCGALRTQAVLGVIVDQWEQQTLEPNQSGRPSTSVQLRAALVDSTGQLLWTANGSETLEGLRREAGETVIGVRASTLNSQPLTNTGDVPTFAETLNKIMVRWAPQFPSRVQSDSAAAKP